MFWVIIAIFSILFVRLIVYYRHMLSFVRYLVFVVKLDGPIIKQIGVNAFRRPWNFMFDISEWSKYSIIKKEFRQNWKDLEFITEMTALHNLIKEAESKGENEK